MKNRSSARVRKPLRRTAWAMFLGGTVVFAAMLGAGVLLVQQGHPVGPAQAAQWSSGEQVSLFRPLGGGQEAGETIECAATSDSGRETTYWVSWGETVEPEFTGVASMRCGVDARLLSGTARDIASTLRGPLVALPGMVALVGILLFFPRFAAVWASLGNPFSPSRGKRDDRDTFGI